MCRTIGGDVVERVDVVFDRYRNALQRAQVLTLGQQLIGPAGLSQCDGCIDLNKCVQERIQALDAVQSRLGQLDTRQAARAQAFGQRGD